MLLRCVSTATQNGQTCLSHNPILTARCRQILQTEPLVLIVLGRDCDTF